MITSTAGFFSFFIISTGMPHCVIDNRNAVILMDNYLDITAVAAKASSILLVHNLIHQMVQTAGGRTSSTCAVSNIRDQTIASFRAPISPMYFQLTNLLLSLLFRLDGAYLSKASLSSFKSSVTRYTPWPLGVSLCTAYLM